MVQFRKCLAERRIVSACIFHAESFYVERRAMAALQHIGEFDLDAHAFRRRAWQETSPTVALLKIHHAICRLPWLQVGIGGFARNGAALHKERIELDVLTDLGLEVVNDGDLFS